MKKRLDKKGEREYNEKRTENNNKKERGK